MTFCIIFLFKRAQSRMYMSASSFCFFCLIQTPFTFVASFCFCYNVIIVSRKTPVFVKFFVFRGQRHRIEIIHFNRFK